MDPTAQYALAYALSTTAGLRGFLTLLAASLAIHAGWMHPAAPFAWLGTSGATLILAVFSVLEFAGDKVPAVDHALHVIQTAVRPMAAAILVGSTVHVASQSELYGLMTVGALNALLVHGSSVTARLASSATTLGTGNAVLSFAEDALAIGGIVLSFAAPAVAAVLALIFVAALVFIAARLYLRTKKRPALKAPQEKEPTA